MSFRKSILIIAFLSLFLGIPSQAYADVEKGLAAAINGDYETALKEWLVDAKEGNSDAQYYLGVMYSHGDGVPENAAEAMRWYQLAAAQGDSGAQSNLGVMYDIGNGVPENDKEAARWYLLAADQGDSIAQYNLGRMYDKGDGVPANKITAYMWWSLSAAQGVELARSNKEKLRTKMTQDQISEAQRLSANWFEEHK